MPRPARNWHRYLRVFSISIIAIFAALFLFLRATSVNGIDRFGNALAPDLVTFYVAGEMVAHGEWNQIYNAPAFFARANVLLGGHEQSGGDAFLYPPYVPWLCVPLAWVSYSTSATFYLLLNIALAAWLARSIAHRLVSDREWAHTTSWLFLASLPLIRCVLYGQNGLVSLAILWGGWLLWQERRHFACGLVLGLGAFKPQLFLGVWGWLMLFGNTRARSGLILAGMLWFGLGYVGNWPEDPWTAWLRGVGHWNDSSIVALQKHAIWNAFDLTGPCPEWLSGLRLTCWGITTLAWGSTLIALRFGRNDRTTALAWIIAVWGWVWLTPRLLQYDLVMLYPALLMAWPAVTLLPVETAKWQRRLLVLWVISFYLSDAFARAGIPVVTILGLAILFGLCRAMLSDNTRFNSSRAA